MDHTCVACQVFDAEIEELKKVKDRLGHEFNLAVDLISNSSGRVIICGMGKSGLIGKKVAATLASTGTPSYFLHPGEAFHGDLGMVKPEDVFIGISYSGETEELIRLIPFLRKNGNRTIAITGNQVSTLACAAEVHLNVFVGKEACPHQLAPTSSTTATLVMGDALAIALMNFSGFQSEDFAVFHPGGSLGRKLLSRVSDEMLTEDLPLVEPITPLIDLITIMTERRMGVAVVRNLDGSFGLITDGDLRRAFQRAGETLNELTAEKIMSTNPISITSQESMTAAWETMERNRITTLLVIDSGELIGILKK